MGPHEDYRHLGRSDAE